MRALHVENIANNQIVLDFFDDADNYVKMLVSYGSNIAKISENGSIKKTVYLDSKYWDYSKTTGKYRNLFLGETKAQTEKKIESGEYILADLNK